MAAAKRSRKSSKKVVAEHLGWKALAAAFPEKESFMTSLTFGVFLFLFSAFIAVVPASAWTEPVNNSIRVGDALGQGFENSMEILENNVLTLGVRPAAKAVENRITRPLGNNLAYVAFVVGRAAPRSLPSAIRGGHGSPAVTLNAAFDRVDRNLKMNPATLAESYRARPGYLLQRQQNGLRRFRHQVPLRWNALGEGPANPNAS